MLKSKFIDLALILIMGYFSFTRFSDGQTGIGIFFIVLCLLNGLTLVMKIKQEKAAESNA